MTHRFSVSIRRWSLRPLLTATVLTTTAFLAACVGTTTEPTEESIYSVKGTVTQGLGLEPPSKALEVGVLWLNWLEGEGESTVLVETTPADVIGTELPVAFDVSVLKPPSDKMLGTALISYSESGSSEQPVDRNRVAFGVVVVAPEGTLQSLPESVSFMDFINGSDGTPGLLLSAFTYVSPFTVRYVKGASEENVTIRDINGVESKLEDMTMFDIGKWAGGIANAVCRDQFLGEGWNAPEVKECIANNGGENDGNIQNQCLYEYAASKAAEIDALCGPQPDYAESDFRNSRQLKPGETITLPLGEGDIRKALTHGGFIFLG